MKPLVLLLISTAAGLFCLFAPDARAATYGYGTYGSCQYQTCSISISSSSTVALNVTPAGGTTRCTVAKDTVTVATSSSTGYSLSLGDTDTATTLASGGNIISSTSGTYASPSLLTSNTWGYRIDGSGGTFGAGPTSAQSNGAIPTLSFAGVKSSSTSADTIASQTSAATGGVATSVWYGVCVGATAPSGSYSDSVTYTALTN